MKKNKFRKSQIATIILAIISFYLILLFIIWAIDLRIKHLGELHPDFNLCIGIAAACFILLMLIFYLPYAVFISPIKKEENDKESKKEKRQNIRTYVKENLNSEFKEVYFHSSLESFEFNFLVLILVKSNIRFFARFDENGLIDLIVKSGKQKILRQTFSDPVLFLNIFDFDK